MELRPPESGDGYELVELPPEPASVAAPTLNPLALTVPAPPPTGAAGASLGQGPEQGANGAAASAPAKAPRRPRRKPPKRKWDLPSWGVSVLVHIAVLGGLALATLDPQVRKAVANLNTALVDTKNTAGEKELVPILADPSN